jgi:hypothetical protein
MNYLVDGRTMWSYSKYYEFAKYRTHKQLRFKRTIAQTTQEPQERGGQF